MKNQKREINYIDYPFTGPPVIDVESKAEGIYIVDMEDKLADMEGKPVTHRFQIKKRNAEC